MIWTVICPNGTCQRKLSLPNAPSDKIKCPHCNQIFMVQRSSSPPVNDIPAQQSPFGVMAESIPVSNSTDFRKNTSWPVWIIGLLILQTLITAFCGILVGVKLISNKSGLPDQGANLNLKASGPSNFFYRPHSPDFMDDAIKANEWWTKTYSIKDRTMGSAVSIKIYDDEVPDNDVLERMGRVKLTKLFPENRYQIQAGTAKLDAVLAGEKAISIPVDITPLASGEGDSQASKIMVGELRICSRRGIAYWFATWGPEGSKNEQSNWDKTFIFGNGRTDWKPKDSIASALIYESVKIKLGKSTWKIASGEMVKQLADGRPGVLAHAEGTIVEDKKSKAELSIVSTEGKKSLDRATALTLEWQKLLNGSDSEAPAIKIEKFGDEEIFYKVLINQKTETFLYLQETAEKSGYLVIGECRFEDLAIWKGEFLKISRSLKLDK